MTETEKLINEVLAANEEQDTECFLATSAPKLARMLQKAIEQRDEVIEFWFSKPPRLPELECHIQNELQIRNAELDKLAEALPEGAPVRRN